MASPRGKRSTESARIERLGVALCHSIVADMGHIWRDKGVDYGVDGEIELIDEGEVLGRVLWVQSKAQSDRQPFSGETDRSFRFMCSQVDIDYWMSGTAPVLLVCSHPESKEAWFKHLPSWFSDPRRRRERYVEFDKKDDRFDDNAARRLLTLGVHASSGLYLRPPPRVEKLTTNLLRVEHTAPQIHVASTRCRGWADARPRLVRAGHNFVNDVVFRNSKAYSFRQFDEPPLDVLADGATEVIDTNDISDSTDPDNDTLIRWLLKATLIDMKGRDLRRHPDQDYLYFKLPRDGGDKRVKVDRGRGRAVVQRYTASDDQTWLSYTRHYAVRTQFIYADGVWYLSLTPTYHFTSDGKEDFSYSATQLAKIKRIEGHEAIRSQIIFWARYLGSHNLLSQQDPRLRLGTLVTVDVDRGIDDKSWKPVQEVQDVEPDDLDEGTSRLFDLNEDDV